MKRYSPSATETWLACPLKRHLSVQGWQSRSIGKPALARILGVALAAGFNCWKASQQAGVPVNEQLCVDVAKGSVLEQLADLANAGCRVNQWDAAQEAALLPRVERGIRQLLANDPIPPGWKILDVERSIPEWGNCRIDLALETPLGVVVWDWKTKLTLDAKWLPRDTERWALSEQRWHYSVAYGDLLQRPVYAFYIGLVVLEPFRVHVLPFVNDPSMLTRWEQAREQTWRDVEEEEIGKRQIGMAAKHGDEYGACEFVKACFEYQLDAGLMAQEFTMAKKGA